MCVYSRLLLFCPPMRVDVISHINYWDILEKYKTRLLYGLSRTSPTICIDLMESAFLFPNSTHVRMVSCMCAFDLYPYANRKMAYLPLNFNFLQKLGAHWLHSANIIKIAFTQYLYYSFEGYNAALLGKFQNVWQTHTARYLRLIFFPMPRNNLHS